MGRLIAVGDVHGRLAKLEGLMGQVKPTPEDRIIFLGDYIDRGPDSYGVVEFLLELKERCPLTVTLRGNHEDYIISLFMGNINAYEKKLWLRDNGGNLTIDSYRREGEMMVVHRDFYMNLPHKWEDDEFFFCHAGIRPGIPLDSQRQLDLVDIREPFLSSTADHGKVIVHGHSHQREVESLPNRINIDTGAGRGGAVTAVELPQRHFWQQW